MRQLAACALLLALAAPAAAAPRIVVSPKVPTTSQPIVISVLGDTSAACEPWFEGAVDASTRQILLTGHEAGPPMPCVQADWTAQVELPPVAAGGWTVVARLNGNPYASAPLLVAASPTTVFLGSTGYFETNFRLEVEWVDPRDGQRKLAPGVALSDRGALFWFFDPGMPEVTVKVLDGTAINGHYWLFASSMTGVEFTLRARMCVEGDPPFCTDPVAYRSPAGRNLDVVDVEAF